MKKTLFNLATFVLLSTIGHAAPTAKKLDSAASKTPVAAPLKTGVNITPITRNEKASPVTLQLAKGGKALLPIIISGKASAQTKLIATDLKKYLDQMSGAKFEIKTGDGTSGIVLGTKTEFPVPALDKALAIVHGFDGKEAYAIRTRENKLLLLAAHEYGVGHVAYRLLDELNCRWLFPDATGTWTVIPKTPDLKFAKEITDRPAFLSRSIWYAWTTFHDAGHPQSTSEHKRDAGTDSSDWMRRNHMGESFNVNAGHSYEAYARTFAAEFEKHPEYWAMVNGQRSGPQFEIANPGLRKLLIDGIVASFKANPNSDMVSVDPADGGIPSDSPEAKAYASANDAPFKFANEVAVALEKEFPGQNKMVGLYAYNWHSNPPAFKLEPNVYVQMTMGFIQSEYSLDQLFDLWSKKATNLGFYDYYSTWRWDHDMWPGGRAGRVTYPIAMIKTFQEVNAKSGAVATSISAESGNNWALHGRSYYLAARLMWNPDLDPEAIMTDFYDTAFGPAAPAMREYFSYQENPPKMAPGVVGNLWRALKKARVAAKDRPDVLLRLDDITNYLHFYDLGYRGQEGSQLAKWTLAYRTRYSYMNHWEAIRQDDIHDTGDVNAPWRIDKPITREETETWLDEGAKAYPELKVPVQLEYSKDWVPVNLGGEKKAFNSATFQGGLRVVLQSLKGEPLEIEVLPGTMYGGSGHSYQLTDEKGKVLASGKPAKVGEAIPYKFPVPAVGTYFFDWSDNRGDVWFFKTPANQPMAFDLDKLASATTLYQQTPPLYFYVPKGTKNIEYYFNITAYSASDAHDVYGPDGKLVQEVRVSANYVSVSVPAGMDGKAWHFAGPRFGLGYFHFYNCPNILSPSPAQMLLPKSIVEKDGLKVLQ